MTERDTPERAGASRQEEPAMFVCSFCQRGDYCPTAPHYAAPPAPETPPRPTRYEGETDTDFSYRLLSWYAKPPCPRCGLADKVEPQHGGVFLTTWGCVRCHNLFGRSETLDATLRADLAADPFMPERAAQPNAESAAVQKCEGIPDIWDGRDWGAQHCDGCGAAQALRERCEALADTLRQVATHRHDITPGHRGAFDECCLGWCAKARAALSGGGGPSK